ncbi:MAG: hypothetical protein EBS19_05130 [Spirochaetia bacterium]|nr:hypothetical protein [Spirochaetia bacterium]
MGAEAISGLSVDRVKEIITSSLLKFFGNDSQRLKIYQGGNRLNFCCPYCGDSRDAKKKRGNLYLDTLTYKCYNGGCGIFKNLNQFTRDFEIQSMLSSREISEIAEISRNSTIRKKIRNSLDYFFSENYKDILVDREEFKEKLGLIELPGTYGERWLNERNHAADNKFLWDPNRRNLYLINLSGDEKKILGIQIRPVVKKNGGSKYYTYKLSGIYKNLLKITDPEIILKAEDVDPVSNVFGFSTVDLDTMITTFEGPLDAWLCPNSIALCSINNPFPFEVTNKRWMLDGDDAGRKKSREFLEKGEQVFLWGRFIKECDLPERSKWDLNDVVNYVRSTGKKIKRLDNFFSSDKWDIIDV